jgi:hypothetical protein
MSLHVSTRIAFLQRVESSLKCRGLDLQETTLLLRLLLGTTKYKYVNDLFR